MFAFWSLALVLLDATAGEIQLLLLMWHCMIPKLMLVCSNVPLRYGVSEKGS